MLDSIIKNIKDIKKYTDERMKIPFMYIIFSITLFLFFNTDFIEMIDISSWFPNSIEKIILTFVNLLYSKYLIIIAILLIILIVIMFITEKDVFRKLLPKDISYTDSTTDSWNEYAAIRRVSSIIIDIYTNIWIIYFTINVLFNKYNYSKNFFLAANNPLIKNNYISENTLLIMNILLFLNIAVLIIFIIRSLFRINTQSNQFGIYEDDFYAYYQINDFIHKTSSGSKYKTIILKDKYAKTSSYYLVTAQINRSTYNENNFKLEKYIHNPRYKIIDKSDSLNDIIYHFNTLKNSEPMSDN